MVTQELYTNTDYDFLVGNFYAHKKSQRGSHNAYSCKVRPPRGIGVVLRTTRTLGNFVSTKSSEFRDDVSLCELRLLWDVMRENKTKFNTCCPKMNAVVDTFH